MEVILGQGQHLRFSRLGASHHNGVSKIFIEMVVYMALTIIIDAAIKIP